MATPPSPTRWGQASPPPPGDGWQMKPRPAFRSLGDILCREEETKYCVPEKKSVFPEVILYLEWWKCFKFGRALSCEGNRDGGGITETCGTPEPPLIFTPDLLRLSWNLILWWRRFLVTGVCSSQSTGDGGDHLSPQFSQLHGAP